MIALYFDGQARLVTDYPNPKPPAGEVLVRMRLVGICNTDLEIMRGYLNFKGVLGHEFVGELDDGRRVVGEINTWDGTCPACRQGHVTHCENRTTLGIRERDGVLAEYCVLPEINLHEVQDGVNDDQAVFVEPLAAALEITDQIHIRPSQRVGVIGDGKLGLLCAQVLALTGCDLLVIGRHARKLTILERRGIRTTTSPENLKRDFDVIVECTGKASGLELAHALLRPRGTLVLKSTFHGSQEVAMSGYVVDETMVIGSRCGPFEPALRLLEKGLIDVESLIDARYPLHQGLEALNHAGTSGTLKVLVTV